MLGERGPVLLAVHGGPGMDHASIRPWLDWRTILPLYFHELSAREIDCSAARITFRLATRKAVLPTFAEYDLRPRLRQILAPALVVVGRHDWITSVGQAEVLADGLRHSQLEVFKQSGHLPFVEEPERFLAVVGEWLDAQEVR